MAILVCFSSCDRFREQTNTNFDVTYHGVVSVPEGRVITNGGPFPSSGGLSVDFPAVAVATKSRQYADEYHIKTDKVVKAHLLMFRFYQAPTYHNLDYVDSIHVYMSTSDLPEILVARRSIIPKNQFMLDMVPETFQNLKEYFKQDIIYLRTELYINKLPDEGNKFDLVPTIYVEAKSVL
jgi:hypothetical protein